MKRISIRDVAEKAAVSKSTVSHVINNTRFVEEETKQRVLQAIQELGYHPSIAARSLTTNRTETIGLLVSDASNVFFGEVLRGVDDVLRPANYGVIVCSTDEILEREEHYLNLLLRQRVDGIIAAATSQKWEILDWINTSHIPIVFLDRTYNGMNDTFVGVDNQAGACLGARYLIGCGRQKIGILAGFQRLSTMRERLAGFQQAVTESGLALPEEWVIPSRLSIEDGREAALRMLSLPNGPEALFMSNNLLSLGTLLALKELGLRCPDDVALLGFDDHPWAAVSNPPLTVVAQPSRQIGQVAAQMLLQRMNGQTPSETQVLLKCELVLRESC